MPLDNNGSYRSPLHAPPRTAAPSPHHIVAESIRALPLMLNAEQACWCLGISLSTFHRRTQDGSIRPGILISQKSRRWEKAYILSLMAPSPSAPATAVSV